ncbi:hypothetical protein BV25DRAFT_1817429 [Artomyces pyxidatus]|uniref:Uncharacterized protein n=1 Tax=Artomyces pyxidatus TaxID=48021 RepID=A0ACB8TJH2_9AGAM|nr:hypothetical protein BV25DRAFT_1817429 [Artomyces pyxidatus]
MQDESVQQASEPMQVDEPSSSVQNQVRPPSRPGEQVDLRDGDEKQLLPIPQTPPHTASPKELQKEDTIVIEHHETFSPELLAQMNVKVRDFAYESKLPPIPSIPRVRLQQPDQRPLKRLKLQRDDRENPFSQRARQLNGGAEVGPAVRIGRPLERKSTEPVLIPTGTTHHGPTRAMGFLDLSEYSGVAFPRLAGLPHSPPASRHEQDSEFLTGSPGAAGPSRTTRPQLPPLSFPGYPSQPPLGDSQESDLQVDTPLITPVGSVQWPIVDTSEIPTSQLDTESQQPAQDDVTYSQLGFSQQPFSQPSESQMDCPVASAHTSPARTERSGCPSPDTKRTLAAAGPATPYSPRSSPAPLAGLHPPAVPGSFRCFPEFPALPPTPSDSPHSPPSRYFLRKRANSPSASTSAGAVLPSPRRKAQKLPSPLRTRLAAVTRQSSHSRSPKSSRQSPRARPLKKTVA